MTSPATQYTPLSKLLHWLVAGMVVLQFILAYLAERAGDAGHELRELALLANHKSVGITILALAIARLAWRRLHPPPPLPPSMPAWQVTASRLSHWLLYGLLLAMPVSGWLMSSASAYSVSWFNVLQLPDFVAPDAGLKATFLLIHELLAKLLFAVACVHILAALKHALLDRDDVLRRMLSMTGLLAFVVVIAGGAAWLGSGGGPPPARHDDAPQLTPPPQSTERVSPPPAQAEPGDPAPAPEPAAPVELPTWRIDPARSYIRFAGSQAGASFQGAWQSWHAELRFSPGALGASAFDVTIDTTSPATGDTDRDATLADMEWFDSARFPEAYYRATRFQAADGGGFIAHGLLTIKDRSTPVQLRFKLVENGNARLLTGTARLDRLQLGVGTGEWEDTEWIGQFVTVDVRVEASVTQ